MEAWHELRLIFDLFRTEVLTRFGEAVGIENSLLILDLVNSHSPSLTSLGRLASLLLMRALFPLIPSR